ncbi:MAG: YggS family pyridoxal phosphate-dependent enzyme [Candidatus Micrarchaeota archaeon]
MLKTSLPQLMGEILAACKKSNRIPANIRLVAVSKNQPLAAIKEAFDLGIFDFGENKVQEAEGKIPIVASLIQGKSPMPPINWHFIGRLQTNKVKKAVSLFNLIHSVDSLALAKKIDAEAKKQNKVQKVLLQVNVSGEMSKAGFDEKELVDSFPKISSLKNLQLLGLMEIAPILGKGESEEKSRRHFKALRILRDALQSKFSHQLPELSMGMSQDYPVAIEEGATMVRIGSAIFGKR